MVSTDSYFEKKFLKRRSLKQCADQAQKRDPAMAYCMSKVGWKSGRPNFLLIGRGRSLGCELQVPAEEWEEEDTKQALHDTK